LRTFSSPKGIINAFLSQRQPLQRVRVQRLATIDGLNDQSGNGGFVRDSR
jgi:hypothetical protein